MKRCGNCGADYTNKNLTANTIYTEIEQKLETYPIIDRHFKEELASLILLSVRQLEKYIKIYNFNDKDKVESINFIDESGSLNKAYLIATNREIPTVETEAFKQLKKEYPNLKYSHFVSFLKKSKD